MSDPSKSSRFLVLLLPVVAFLGYATAMLYPTGYAAFCTGNYVAQP